jgi:hypothetical protein
MDRTADAAHGRLDTHEAVCGERYKSLDNGLNELKAMILAQGSIMHERFNVISNRMWAVVVSVCGASVMGMAVLAFYVMTKGH